MNQCQSYCRLIKRMCNSKAPLLPEEYQQVEYLQSKLTSYSNATTGHNRQWIEVGINYFADVEVDAQLTNSSYGGKICGVAQNNCLQRVSSANPYFSCWNTSSNYYMTNANIYTRHKVRWKSNQIYVDDVFVANYTKQSASGPFILFGAGGKWYSSDNFYMTWPYVRIYGCKLWDNNSTLIRNLISCYRKSDNKPGMYDIVTNTFFINAGTGEFIVGNNV